MRVLLSECSCLPAVLPIYTNGARAQKVGVTFSRYTMSNLSAGSGLYWWGSGMAQAFIAYGSCIAIAGG